MTELHTPESETEAICSPSAPMGQIGVDCVGEEFRLIVTVKE